jgi:pimeloyl-ACP methyl ester carboxylesterase
MRRRISISTLAMSVLVSAWLFAAAQAPAADALTSTACPGEPTFTCATLPVPLDRAGLAAGTISLNLKLMSAGPTPSRDAVIALAGGPGQAAAPLADFLAKTMGPALTTRDLVVFDQRGTGKSDPLNCPALSDTSALETATPDSFGGLVEKCALQIGPSRDAFTTEESVQDIEAIRQALGYEKLVLYGTSYGTKVALEYAERYPQNVEALVLDSVVASNGPDPFDLPTFAALRPVLSELCANKACAHITSSPLSDIAKLAAQLPHHPLSGSVYDGSGHRHSASLDEDDLLGILEAGDLNPALRALLPGAVRSALRHDSGPLLRLDLLAEGLIPNVPITPQNPEEGSASEEENNALFLTTSCEEKPLPWQRAAPPTTRHTEALTALSALPSADFYPFDANTALEESLIPECVDWPYTPVSPNPTPTGVLPDVPTLVLSGGQDLRTPTSGARQIVAKIPGSELLVVPHTGHSVLGSDFSGCAQEAVTAFFAHSPVTLCKPTPSLFTPTPIAPTKLAYIHPVAALGGNPGRTLTAVLDTIVDLERQVIGATLQINQSLPNGASFGGLRGGYAQLSTSAVHLSRFSFVAGVQLTGTFAVSSGKLGSITVKVDGSAASSGTVRIGSDKHASGTLGARRFNVSIANAKLSSDTTGGWPSRSVRFPLSGPRSDGVARLR